MVCVCGAAELVELDRLVVVNDAVGLPLLGSVLACARHTEGRYVTKRREMRSSDAQGGILDIVEIISAVQRLEIFAGRISK
jgi:hypothetical protein